MIPPLNDFGLLPQGVWPCQLYEVSERFATSPGRRKLWEGFQTFSGTQLRAVEGVGALYIDGSYTTDKPDPSDIDVVADLVGIKGHEALLQAFAAKLRRQQFKQQFGVDFWVRHPELPGDFAAFFQQVGDKAAARLGLHPSHPKGILKVQL